MQQVRYRLAWRASVVLVFALLLAPLAVQAHWHRAGEAAPPCSICVAAHQSPALLASGHVDVLPLVQVHAVALPALSAPRCAWSTRPSGRSPPLLPTSGVV